jgi:PRTRC genetic system protein C
MALQIQNMSRVFQIEGKGKNNVTLEDPNPHFTPQEVVSFYSNTYPEITNSNIAGPEIEGGKAVYKISSVVGSKG